MDTQIQNQKAYSFQQKMGFGNMVNYFRKNDSQRQELYLQELYLCLDNKYYEIIDQETQEI